MRRVDALIDGIRIDLNIPEEQEEFRQGIRGSGGNLEEQEGYLFNFVKPSVLYFENCGVSQDVTLLFFHPFVDNKMGVVTGVKNLEAGSVKIVSSESPFSVALELRTDFCINNNLKEGSILTLQEELE